MPIFGRFLYGTNLYGKGEEQETQKTLSLFDAISSSLVLENQAILVSSFSSEAGLTAEFLSTIFLRERLEETFEFFSSFSQIFVLINTLEVPATSEASFLPNLVISNNLEELIRLEADLSPTFVALLRTGFVDSASFSLEAANRLGILEKLEEQIVSIFEAEDVPVLIARLDEAATLSAFMRGFPPPYIDLYGTLKRTSDLTGLLIVTVDVSGELKVIDILSGKMVRL